MNGAAEIAEMMETFRNNPPKTIDGIAVKELKDFQLQQSTNLNNGQVTQISLPKSNVLQFILDDESVISARPSGTEPKIKFYFSVNAKLNAVADFDKTEKMLDDKIERIIKELKLK
jgi:phosphoglucomutase